ncbi:unnamed protein product [Blepharisma stoltei]|uniref:Uncharacterized protein n=1 Tax=Blepharisma stoltei TaxID=1481888 RepID=A0AAU9J7D5_9CILI|nr:unnamed protein product [Blepharisma stoltei]
MQLDPPLAVCSKIPLYKGKVLCTSIITLVWVLIPIVIFLIVNAAAIILWLIYLCPYITTGISGICISRSTIPSRISTVTALFICLLVYSIINVAFWGILFMVLIIAINGYSCNSSDDDNCSTWEGLGWFFTWFTLFFAVYFLVACFLSIRGIRVSRILKAQLANQTNSNQIYMLSPGGYTMQGQNLQAGYQQFSGSNTGYISPSYRSPAYNNAVSYNP